MTLANPSGRFRLLQFSGPHFYQFWAEPGPSPGPFLEKVDFEGDPKIVILGTESTFMSAENSINPCIKATSGPTSSILKGSGTFMFFGRFSSREKYAKEALHVRPVPKMGPQKVPILSNNYENAGTIWYPVLPGPAPGTDWRPQGLPKQPRPHFHRFGLHFYPPRPHFY